jgi:predicted DNA-binding protein (UPF0251 family)
MLPPLSLRRPAPETKPAEPAAAFEWSRSLALALSLHHCQQCHGGGILLGRKTLRPCGCVLRAVFRICLNKYRQILVDQEGIRTGAVFQQMASRPLTTGTMTSRPGRTHKLHSWGRPMEEFLADFVHIARRALDPAEFELLRMHHLWGADWKICCRALRINRGVFFHSVYRTEQKLGRAFAETRPYSLFPLVDYFHAVVDGRRSQESGVRSQHEGAAAPVPEPLMAPAEPEKVVEPGVAEPVEEETPAPATKNLAAAA